MRLNKPRLSSTELLILITWYIHAMLGNATIVYVVAALIWLLVMLNYRFPGIEDWLFHKMYDNKPK